MLTNCPRCYAALNPVESPQGLCPKCLLAVAMGEDAVLRTRSGEPLPAPPEIEDLQPHFPQLKILAPLGRGGAGAVYSAIQSDLGRRVALKVLLHDAEEDPAFGERFVREARAMASLTHPNIASIHDAGRAGPYWFLVMELIDGRNLRQIIRAGDFAPHESLDVVRQISGALEYAHAQGVVHRDIKPENVLVDGKGLVKLVDFGLAKLLVPDNASLTRTGQAMGTWHYMAPEQMHRPLEVDHRADIYSLGVVLYELLTGEVPQGRYAPASERARGYARVDRIVDRALEQDPDRRYQQVRSVREDVESLENPPEAPEPKVREWLPRIELEGRKAEPGEITAVLLSLAVVAAVAWFLLLTLGGEAEEEPPRILGPVVVTPADHDLADPGPDGSLWAPNPTREHLVVEAGKWPEELGYAAVTVEMDQLLQQAQRSYLALEEEHARKLSGVVIAIEPFQEQREALVEQLRADLRAEGAPYPRDDRFLFPYGKELSFVQLGETVVEAVGPHEQEWKQADVPLHVDLGRLTTYLLGSAPAPREGDLSYAPVPFSLEEMGYRWITRDMASAFLTAHTEYVAIESRHARRRRNRLVIDPFPAERLKLVSDLRAELKRLGQPYPTNDRELFPYGEDEAELDFFGPGLGDETYLGVREHWTPRVGPPSHVQQLISERLELIPYEPGTELTLFNKTYWDATSIGLPKELPGEVRIVLGECYDEYRRLENEHAYRRQRGLRAGGGSRSADGFPLFSVPHPPALGGLHTLIRAFPDEHAALTRRARRVIDKHIVDVDPDEVLSYLFPFGAEEAIAVAGEVQGVDLLVAQPTGGEGRPRLVWGGELDERYRRFFGSPDPIIEDFEVGAWVEFDLDEPKSSRSEPIHGAGLHPFFDAERLDEGTSLILASHGAELLTESADHYRQTPEGTARADKAWEDYVVLLLEHRTTSVWRDGTESYIQVDVRPFPEELDALLSTWPEDLVEYFERLQLPGAEYSSELRINDDGSHQYFRKSSCRMYAFYEAFTRGMEGSIAFDAQRLRGQAREFSQQLSEDTWGPGLDPAPGAFKLLVRKVVGEAWHYDRDELEVRLHPSRPNAVQIHFPARPEAHAQLVNSHGRLMHVKPEQVLPFAESGGTLTVEWTGDQPKVVEVRTGEGRRLQNLRHGRFDEFLDGELGNRAELWCAPHALGLPTDPSPTVAWTIARAFWEYQSIVHEVAVPMNVDGPRLGGDDAPRQLRHEGGVLHVPEFAVRRKVLLEDLHRGLRELGVVGTDFIQLDETMFPFGSSALDLARIDNEDGVPALWAEMRGVPFDEPDRITRLSHDANRDWRFRFLPWN